MDINQIPGNSFKSMLHPIETIDIILMCVVSKKYKI